MPDIKFEKPLPFEEALLHLPPGYNSRALRAHRDKPYCKIEQRTLSSAVNMAFIWSDSKEGKSFWRSVYHYYLDEEEALPPLPKDD